ncbi:hypothetical protein CAEBREN_31140 [Caenorhabditis brenneri]|uniref:Seven TM Receptor n=1 Tax=Caenorhabditis brenneri TaxID=135651 RepID=G0P0H3_CAEBE|nr:hypothetical protein CAEBREN_31140 [Caenorhabditis brenneri]
MDDNNEALSLNLDLCLDIQKRIVPKSSYTPMIDRKTCDQIRKTLDDMNSTVLETATNGTENGIFEFLSTALIVKKHETKVIIGLLSIPILFGLLWEYLMLNFVSPFDQADRFLVENHLDKLGVNLSDVKYAGLYFWPVGQDGQLHIYWRSTIGMSIMFLIIKFFTKGSFFVVAIYDEQSLAPSIFSQTLCEFFSVFFGISMAIFAIHFIYRYLVVSGENHLNKVGVNLTDVKYAGVYFWPVGEDGKVHIHWKSSIGIFIMFISIQLSLVIILVLCYFETYKLMQNASQSSSFKKLQSQLFQALVLQTIIPLVLMHLPAAVGFIAAFFNVSFEFLGDICSVSIYLYPTLDPLPNFFIIKNYREAILGALRAFKNKILRIKTAKVEVESVLPTENPTTPEN